MQKQFKSHELAPFIIVLLVGIFLGCVFTVLMSNRLSPISNNPEAPVSPTPTPKTSCEYQGTVYQNGEGFKMDCNTCTCMNGEIACTLMACGTP